MVRPRHLAPKWEMFRLALHLFKAPAAAGKAGFQLLLTLVRLYQRLFANIRDIGGFPGQMLATIDRDHLACD